SICQRGLYTCLQNRLWKGWSKPFPEEICRQSIAEGEVKTYETVYYGQSSLCKLKGLSSPGCCPIRLDDRLTPKTRHSLPNKGGSPFKPLLHRPAHFGAACRTS
ncbi:unnamed protein product, partial [Ectocarpus sp. 8 AP-2014]